jgi:hypothetical protein
VPAAPCPSPKLNLYGGGNVGSDGEVSLDLNQANAITPGRGPDSARKAAARSPLIRFSTR